tara:strand:+ start:12408 stop:13040 length:633 start_codon:yes stop_codon:yes gene_type:complete
MVLISHKYKFIYIKNMKVAGSSVESFFGKYCINPASNYTYNDDIDEHVDDYGIIGSRATGKGTNWVSHISAQTIERQIGKEVFNEYLKFCVIRNPYDKMVSRYFYDISKERTTLPFKDWCKKQDVSNLKFHCINGKSVSNYFIRYEHLEEDIIKLCELLGITDFDINDLPKHKSTQRISTNHYSHFYDEETRNIVYENHKKEFELFGYEK